MREYAEAYRSALIECTQDLIWAVDRYDRLAHFNGAFRNYIKLAFGIEPSKGMRLHTLQTAESATLWCSSYERTRLDGNLHLECSLAGGSMMGFTLRPVVAQGKTIGVTVCGREIVERDSAGNQLTESDARIHRFFHENSSVMLMVDPSNGEIVAANRAASTYYGLPEEELIGLPTKNISISPPERVERNMLLALRRECGIFNYRIRLANGEERDVESHVSRFDIKGKPLLFAIVHDVTERKRFETALQVARNKYREIFEGALEGMFQTTLDGKVMTANPALARILGYESPDDLKTSINNLAHDVWEDCDERSRYLKNLLAGEAVQGYQCRFKRKDGRAVWVSVNSRVVFAKDGQATYHEGFLIDISDHKLAEQSLREIAESLEEAQRIGGLGSYVLDIASGTWTSSDTLDGLFGIDKAYDRVVSGWSALIHADDRAMMLVYMADVISGRITRFDKEYRIIRRADQAERWVHGLGRIESDAQGKPRILRGVIKDITARKQSEIVLRESEERFRESFEQAAVGMLHTSLEGKILRANARFAEIIGYAPDEIPGLSFQQITFRDDLDKSNATLQRMTGALAQVSPPSVWDKRYVRKDGRITWVKLTISVQRDSEGRALHYITVVEDINERKAAEVSLSMAQEALRLSEERYRTVFQTSLDCITIKTLEEGKFIDVNQAFLNLMGFKYQEVVGHTWLELDFWADPRSRDTMAQLLRRDSSFKEYETQYKKRNGEIFWVRISAFEIEIDGTRCVLSVMRDISDAKAAEEEIWNLAYYDTLTRLPNRRLLLDRLRQALATTKQSERNRALLFVDLDDFKTLNDTLGHQTGDRLLQEVATRLAKSVRQCDTVARLGGDEFVVMLEGLSIRPEEAATQAETVGCDILSAINHPYLIDGHECLSTASIGITVFGQKSESADSILQQADIAMYQAKTAGRNTVQFFAPALQAAVNARATIEVELRQAIKAGQFVLHYQPQVDAAGLMGAEVLIRWRHPKHGLLAPGAFIPMAEQSGLILPLGDWVLETAAAQIAAWQGRSQTADITISVNISALQFRQPEFVDQVLMALQRAGANPHSLKLELTESMLVDNIEDVIAKITELKSHGIGFSLDDFGTGYSSLAYLKRLPLDQLKIDRSFVNDIVDNLGSRAIAQSIVSLGKALCMGVIAEGVETVDQRDCLIQLGCHTFQGYLFSCPLPLEDFELLLPVIRDLNVEIAAIASIAHGSGSLVPIPQPLSPSSPSVPYHSVS